MRTHKDTLDNKRLQTTFILIIWLEKEENREFALIVYRTIDKRVKEDRV
jgi:hypothetical protein